MKEKNTRPLSQHGRGKALLLLAVLALALLALSGCYMEPDTTTNGNDLTIGQNTQNFQNIITEAPTNAPTNAPTPTNAPQNTSSGSQVDWTNWNFGNEDPTDPPSNVIQIGGATNAPDSNATNPPSNATPTPTPAGTSSNTTLRSGSEGTEVRQLQTRLKELGYYTGSVDGSYGQGTTNAVKAFQAANKLQADGIAGKTTQDTLYSYYAVAKKDATITVPPSNATNRPTSKPTNKPSNNTGSNNNNNSNTSSQYTNGKTDIYLRLGSTGAQVKILQNRLIVLGYISGTADGTFGETTEAAVAAFQKRNSLGNDGVAGPSTLTKLYSSSAKKANAVVSNLGSLTVGMTGGGVKALQQQLKNLGYYNGKVDGDFGAGTQSAVLAFQAAAGLKQDGIAGTATLNAIYGGGSSGGTSAKGFSASSTGYSTLGEGTQGSSNVKAIQTALRNLGYYSGSVDGNYGSGTKSAVKSYQKAVGLHADGVCGPTTQRYLFGNTSSESASYSSLKSGASGSAVKNLQYTLYELRYYDGDITGSYDALTESAVREFQSVNGLTVDGAAGKQTQRLLYSANAKNALYTGGSSGGGGGGGSGSSSSKYKTLNLGGSSETVMMVQDALVSGGYLTAGAYAVAVYDDATANAMKLFVASNSSHLSSSAPTSGKKATSEILELLLD